jgi:hypothetical protein
VKDLTHDVGRAWSQGEHGPKAELLNKGLVSIDDFSGGDEDRDNVGINELLAEFSDRGIPGIACILSRSMIVGVSAKNNNTTTLSTPTNLLLIVSNVHKSSELRSLT